MMQDNTQEVHELDLIQELQDMEMEEITKELSIEEDIEESDLAREARSEDLHSQDSTSNNDTAAIVAELKEKRALLPENIQQKIHALELEIQEKREKLEALRAREKEALFPIT